MVKETRDSSQKDKEVTIDLDPEIGEKDIMKNVFDVDARTM